MATRGARDDDELPTLDEVTATVRSLVEVMRGNGLTKLDVTSGHVSIRLRAPKSGSGPRTATARKDGNEAPETPTSLSTGHIVTAPMIGTFYSSPSPGEPPFVRVGDPVRAGQTIGIIEAMKIMNEIAADRSGVVLDILVSNAQAVEYGSPLLRLDVEEDGDG